MIIKKILGKLFAWNNNPYAITIKTDRKNFDEQAKKSINILLSICNSKKYLISLPDEIEEIFPDSEYPSTVHKDDVLNYMEKRWVEHPFFIETINSSDCGLLLDYPNEITLFGTKNSIEEIKNRAHSVGIY